MPKGPHIPSEIRAACVVLRFHVGKEAAQIARELNLKPGTVRNTCMRISRAAASTNLLDLLPKRSSNAIEYGQPPGIDSASTERS